MSKFYNNVKTRLNKKGITGFTKADYLLAAEHLGIDDLESITTEQIIAGVEYLMSKKYKELATVSSNDPISNAVPDALSQTSGDSSIMMDDTQSTDESTNLDIADDWQDEQSESSLTVSNADKQSLVASQSVALGFTLTEDETTAIADSIDDVFADYSSFIASVTSAIKGYIAHKFDTIENDLETDTTEVREYLTLRTNRLNQKVANFASNVKAIKSDTEVIRQNLKSSKDAVLSRFRVGILK